MKSTTLKAGMNVIGYYKNGGRDFADHMLIHGCIVGETLYTSVKEAMVANNCKNMGQFEELDPRLDVEDINEHSGEPTGDRGDWYYMYEKRFVRGSGCDVLSFDHFVAK